MKHESRYFFHHVHINKNPHLYGISVVEEPANELCKSLFTIKKDASLFRCRAKPEKFETKNYHKELGPPPLENARASRMSSAGISMFYLAESEKTALEETADKTGIFGIAEFSVTRDIHLIDLVDRSNIEDERFDQFLNDMVTDMTKPIERDDRVHIEYVPTQVFTEMISNDWSDTNGRKIEGLRFPSSRNRGESAYVLFYNQEKFLQKESPFKLISYDKKEFKC